MKRPKLTTRPVLLGPEAEGTGAGQLAEAHAHHVVGTLRERRALLLLRLACTQKPHTVSINHTPSASTTPRRHQPHPVSINHTPSASTTPRQHQPYPVSINYTPSASTTPCQHQRYPMVIKHQPYPVSIKLTARSILAGHVTGRAQTHAVVDGDADAAVSGRGSDG